MKKDLYQEITDLIVRKIESGVMPWRKPWSVGHGLVVPKRENGEKYQGINILLLWMKLLENEQLAGAHWMTYKQAQAKKAQVRKGEKGTKIVFYSVLEKEKELENGEKKEEKIPFLKEYTVFNSSQIDGLGDPYTTVVNKPQPFVDIESYADMFGILRCKVTHKGDRACWIKDTHMIFMPPKASFKSARDYYAVLAHEVIHWTGHKDILNREASSKKTSKSYAFEELVAELGSCFLCAELGLEPHIDNSSAYVTGWLEGLKSDKKFIFQAASQASKAVNYILDIFTGNEISCAA